MERLCATFSSGSLGSLESTTSSGFNRNSVANSNDSSAPGNSLKSKNTLGCLTMAGKKRNVCTQFEKDSTNPPAEKQTKSTIGTQFSTSEMADINSCISPREQRSDVNYPSLRVSPVTGKPVLEFASRSPSIGSTIRPSHPSTIQVSQRTAGPGHNPVPVDPLKLKNAHSQVLVNQDQVMRVCSAVQLCNTQTTNERENKLEVVSSNPKVAHRSNQFPQPRTPASAVCTLRPKLNIIKCGLAKPVESVRPVNHTSIPMPMSRTQIAHEAGFTSSLAPSLQVGPRNDKPVGTRLIASACRKNIPMSKPCNRLRVVNGCDPRRSLPARSETQLRMNTKGLVTNTENGNCKYDGIDCHGHGRIKRSIGSNRSDSKLIEACSN